MHYEGNNIWSFTKENGEKIELTTADINSLVKTVLKLRREQMPYSLKNKDVLMVAKEYYRIKLETRQQIGVINTLAMLANNLQCSFHAAKKHYYKYHFDFYANYEDFLTAYNTEKYKKAGLI